MPRPGMAGGSADTLSRGTFMRQSMRAAAAALLCCATPVMAAEIHVQDPVPFNESAIIAENIKAECRMGAQLATAACEHARAQHLPILASCSYLSDKFFLTPPAEWAYDTATKVATLR
jgi:hypothetical protein